LKTEHVWGVSRILLGWMLLWAFLDKTFGLGYATSSEGAWINGGSPTSGYLKFAVSGIFEPFFTSIAWNDVIDMLFMLGLLLLGIALLLGIVMRLATIGGILMFVPLWSTNVPPANNPLIDQHIVYIFLLIGLCRVKAGRVLCLGSWWSTTPLVKRFPVLE
jgi:thiosulfate dehydrogenase [quinone] large subunit